MWNATKKFEFVELWFFIFSCVVVHREALWTIRAHNSCVRGVCISPEHDTFLSCSDDKTIKMWRLAIDIEAGGAQAQDVSAECTNTHMFTTFCCVDIGNIHWRRSIYERRLSNCIWAVCHGGQCCSFMGQKSFRCDTDSLCFCFVWSDQIYRADRNVSMGRRFTHSGQIQCSRTVCVCHIV